jgi:hypothetical protein
MPEIQEAAPSKDPTPKSELQSSDRTDDGMIYPGLLSNSLPHVRLRHIETDIENCLSDAMAMNAELPGLPNGVQPDEICLLDVAPDQYASTALPEAVSWQQTSAVDDLCLSSIPQAVVVEEVCPTATSNQTVLQSLWARLVEPVRTSAPSLVAIETRFEEVHPSQGIETRCEQVLEDTEPSNNTEVRRSRQIDSTLIPTPSTGVTFVGTEFWSVGPQARLALPSSDQNPEKATA